MPRCANEELDERERSGIVVDICATCRGVWLDRGELEKLIARATIDFDEVEQRRESAAGRSERLDSTPPGGMRAGRDDDRHPRKKRRWFDALGDVFD